MPARKKSATPNLPGEQNTGFPSERELIILAKSEAGLRASAHEVVSIAGANTTSLNTLLSENGAQMIPIFGNEDRTLRALGAASPSALENIPDLTTYYRVFAADDKLEKLAEDLLAQALVESAYIKPAAEPPVMTDEVRAPAAGEAPPATPNFLSRQIYLNAAPAGIDAKHAWTITGGKGQGVRIIDIEGAWRFSHEDLIQNQGGVIGGTQNADIRWRNHGTAVVGEFGGDENAVGITGICPQANVRAISIFGAGQSAAKAIADAANALSPGDIILIELHQPGPRFNFQPRNDQRGYIAVEWWPAELAAIQFATAVRGVIVVEAAGNGAENLDDAIYNVRPAGFPLSWRNPFNLANPQSGAIIVGAGAPPPGTHSRDHGPDRSRLDFSNFAARVDAQGWGREVTTTGGDFNTAGDLQGGSNEDFWYTDTFSGTSSASPIVVGALGCVQGALRAKSKPLLTPATARDLLRTTGSLQQDAPGRPASQRIGNRPNLKQALQKLGLSKAVLKEIIKDKIEIKEQIKEHVKEKLEIKEKIESKEIKDRKEIKEKDFKEFKEKELKELKEKDFKEFKEKDKDLIEGGGGGGVIIPPPQEAEANLAQRVAQLEQAIGQLSHFIAQEHRPDLQTSALNQEADLQELSQQLAQQAAEAKTMKDQKDVEKLREV